MCGFTKKLRLYCCLGATLLAFTITLYINAQPVYAAELPVEYASYEILEWLLIQFGITVHLTDNVVLDNNADTNVFNAIYNDVFDTISFWIEDNKKDLPLTIQNAKDFKAQLKQMCIDAKDGVVEVSQELTQVLEGYFQDTYDTKAKVHDLDMSNANVKDFLSKISTMMSDENYRYLPNLWSFTVEQNGSINTYYAFYSIKIPFDSVNPFMYTVSGYDYYAYTQNGTSHYMSVPFYDPVIWIEYHGSTNSWGIPMSDYRYYVQSELGSLLRILEKDCVPSLPLVNWDLYTVTQSGANFGELPQDFVDVLWPQQDLAIDYVGCPWMDVDDSIVAPWEYTGGFSIPSDIPYEDVADDVISGERTWENVHDLIYPREKEEDKDLEYNEGVIPIPSVRPNDKDESKPSEDAKDEPIDDVQDVPISPPVDDNILNPNWDILKTKFPFCIPFDLYSLAQTFKISSSEAPKFETDINLSWIKYTWHVKIDLSDYKKQIKIFSDGFFVLFVIALAYATARISKWDN